MYRALGCGCVFKHGSHFPCDNHQNSRDAELALLAELERYDSRVHSVECDRDGLMSAIERISHERNEAVSILRRFVNFAKEPPESLETLLGMGNRIAVDAEALLKKIP